MLTRATGLTTEQTLYVTAADDDDDDAVQSPFAAAISAFNQACTK